MAVAHPEMVMTMGAATAAGDLADLWAPVLAQMLDAALLLDPDARLLGASPAALRLLSLSEVHVGLAARDALGLPQTAVLDGPVTLCPPAMAWPLPSILRSVALFDRQGALAGSLLVIGAEGLGVGLGEARQQVQRCAQSRLEAERRRLLYEASLAFGTALAPEPLYHIIHGTLRQLMPCDTLAIAILDEPEQLNYVYLADGRGRWPSERVALTRGLLGYIIRTGLSLRVLGCDPVIEAFFGAEPFGEGEDSTGSLLAVALRIGEQTIGAISVQAMASDAYSSEHLSDLESLAATAAIALQNAHLFARVQELATMDALTGVANRRHFFDLARREIERVARYGRPLSLLMIDADYFKQINDHYGHVVGDEVLQAIAMRCRVDLREVDVIGRYGGEEFLVLLPETTTAQALRVADRLREAVGQTPILTRAGPISASISVGVAGFPPGVTGTVEDLLDQVDRALYSAKTAGRNQARVS